jgi:CarD family transcriptional regulator
VAVPRQGFKTNEFVVYPAHGVGQIVLRSRSRKSPAQARTFRHRLRKGQDDVAGAGRQGASVGMRKLSDPDLVKRALKLSRAAPASSAPCGRAARRNTKRRSIRATSSQSPKWCAISTAPNRSPSSPIPSVSSMKRRSIAWPREIAAVQHVTETEAVKEIDEAA